MRRLPVTVLAALFILPLLLPAPILGQSPTAAISPPGPPETGPGSTEGYRFPGMHMQKYRGNGGSYWIFEPSTDAAGSTPVASESLPVILHFNGCCGELGITTPEEHEAWFTHLTRQGYVIVAPIYADYNEDAIMESSALLFESALNELAKPGHAAVDLDRFAITASSYGGPGALKYTASAGASGWPVPKAFFAMAPCAGRFCWDVPDVSTFPDGLKAVVMAFDADDVPGVEWPQRLFDKLTVLPEADRNYIEVHSDDHGWPEMLASHSIQPIDALDMWGHWKISSALFDCAFSGTNCEYALGSADELTNMGVWSDGVPVRPLTVSTNPIADSALPAAPVSPDAASFASLDPAFDPIVSVGFPQHMAFGPDGRIYVIDGSANQIKVFDAEWERGDPIGAWGSNPGEFQFHPPDIPFFGFGDLAFASDGSLYVTDTYNNRVQVFDPEGNLLQIIGDDPNNRGMLIAPTGIALDEANDRFFVTSYTEGTVKVYAMDGTFIERWGADGPNGVYFNQPADVVVAPDSSVYVAEFGRSRVHHFADDGTPISVIGGNGTDPGQLAEPRGIALDADGNLYVAEYNTLGYGGTRVQVLSPDGEVIGLVTGPDDTTNFQAPSAVSITADGSIYISDEQGRSIYRFLRTTSG